MIFAEHEVDHFLPERNIVTVILAIEPNGSRITVNGDDYDEILRVALDLKNAQSIDECPTLSAITRDSTSGRWSVDVITHPRG